MNEELEKKYSFPGTTANNTVFKTEEDRKVFIEQYAESTRKFVVEQEKRMARSIERSMTEMF